MKEDEIDVECYRCESMVSSNESVGDSYNVRFEKKLNNTLSPKKIKRSLMMF